MVHNGVEATVVKARCGSDVRKMIVHHSDDMTFNDLLLMMQRIFKLSSSVNISLKYKDQDGDYITLADDNDLLLALQTESSLSVIVLCEDADTTQLKKLESQLEAMRDTASGLLETLKAINVGSAAAKKESTLERSAESPPKHPESVATIQPSVHEQVNNNTMGVNHPTPLTVKADLMMREVQQRAFMDGLSMSPKMAQEPRNAHSAENSTSSVEGSQSEPNTEIELTSGSQQITPLVPPVQQNDLGDRNPAPPGQVPNAYSPKPPTFPAQGATQFGQPQIVSQPSNQTNMFAQPSHHAPGGLPQCDIRFGIPMAGQTPTSQYGVPLQQAAAPHASIGTLQSGAPAQHYQVPLTSLSGVVAPPTSYGAATLGVSPTPYGATQPPLGVMPQSQGQQQQTNYNANAGTASGAYNAALARASAPSSMPQSVAMPPSSITQQPNAFDRNASAYPPPRPPQAMSFGAGPGGINPFARTTQPSHHMRFPLQPSVYQQQ